MTRRQISPPRAVVDAARVLGMQIRESRVRKRLTAAELATRSMVSPRTVSLIERGDPSVSIGNVLTVAINAGVPLFGAETPQELHMLRRIGEDKQALMPTRVMPVQHKESSRAF